MRIEWIDNTDGKPVRSVNVNIIGRDAGYTFWRVLRGTTGFGVSGLEYESMGVFKQRVRSAIKQNVATRRSRKESEVYVALAALMP